MTADSHCESRFALPPNGSEHHMKVLVKHLKQKNRVSNLLGIHRIRFRMAFRVEVKTVLGTLASDAPLRDFNAQIARHARPSESGALRVQR